MSPKTTKLLVAIAFLSISTIVVATIIGSHFVHLKPSEKTITIATGSEGGTYFVVGKQLANLFDQKCDQAPWQHLRFTATPSAGSFANLERLLEGKVDIALVGEPALAAKSEDSNATKQIGLIARLSPAVVQLVVRSEFAAKINELSQFSLAHRRSLAPAGSTDPIFFKPLRIYAGGEQSGTHPVVMQLLKSNGNLQQDRDYEIVPDQEIQSYRDAARALSAAKGPKLDAAFFATGLPTEAVAEACVNNCRLINISKGVPGVDTSHLIDACWYENQTEAVNSFEYAEYLACRNDLDDNIVSLIEDTLFDNLSDLLMTHAKLDAIRLDREFDKPPAKYSLHPGVARFRAAEKNKLLIATGPCGGEYYSTGKRLQSILRSNNIDARVVHTDGSLENLELLKQKRPVLALLQYDVALASLWDQPRAVYKSGPRPGEVGKEWSIPAIPGMRQIAAFHEETLYAFRSKQSKIKLSKLDDLDKRHDRLERTGAGRSDKSARQESDEKPRVCIGPELSGTQVLAQAVLAHSGEGKGIELARSPEYDSVPSMIRKMLKGKFDVGFLVAGRSSQYLDQLLHDPTNFEPLDIPESAQRALQGGAVQRGEIDWQTAPPQTVREPRKVSSLNTRAILVANESVENTLNVYKLTQAVVGGAGVLSTNARDLSTQMTSIAPHPEALRYFVDQGLIPRNDLPHPWREIVVRAAVSSFGILLAGLVAVWYWPVGHRLTNEIIAIGQVSDPHVAVEQIKTLRQDIDERLQRWAFRPGRLNHARWKELADMLDQQAGDARARATGALIERIEELLWHEKAPGAIQQAQDLRKDVSNSLRTGQIAASDYDFLVRLLHTAQEQPRQEQEPLVGAGVA
jgi:TRAP-type uncharacterized transport system substrate-binding protein